MEFWSLEIENKNVSEWRIKNVLQNHFADNTFSEKKNTSNFDTIKHLSLLKVMIRTRFVYRIEEKLPEEGINYGVKK